MPYGKEITMEVEPGDTIYELKEFLFSENATDINPDDQLIKFKEHKCSNHSSFQSLGIINNSVLTLSAKQEYVEIMPKDETKNDLSTPSSENVNNHNIQYDTIDIINEMNKPIHHIHSSRQFDSERLLVSSLTPSQTCNLDKCSSLTRIGNILRRYQLFVQKKQCYNYESKQDTNTRHNLMNLYDNDNENKNDITLLNDYNHLLVEHANDFEDVYNTLCAVVYNGTCCTLSKCLVFTRNNRDRNRTSNDTLKKLYFDIDNNNIVTQQLIDKIHCYVFHSFDSGYKLTRNEKQNVLNSAHEQKINVEPGPDFDANIARIHEIIKSKKNQNKSVSSNKYKSDKTSIYSFGQRYFYWNYYKDKDIKKDPAGGYGGFMNVSYSLKDCYVQKRYQNLKSELLLNKIKTLSKSEWLQLKLKANKYLESDIVRNMFCPRKKSAIYYGMTYGQKMDDNHLISMMVYCNNDTLQSKFTETYRRINENESNEQLKQRHSNYHFLGRFLREVIECFGMKVPVFNRKLGNFRLYHGVNQQFVFESMFAAVSGPFSTTTDYSVAVSFSRVKGMILELNMSVDAWIMRMDEGEAAQQRICCFDCKWISDFSSESEIFCIGGQILFYVSIQKE